ncbi:class I SAM-dependent methyltransferase [Stenotrophomonas humi]|uniref:class I SAM-dependent methyltransferase n=1 Tax=Stenotrophomonas humi TaxID=405444 RepID=UPI00070EB833|nr:class I SAM-dependent methyltransferase [Stenotrophomonas humi]
MRALERIIKKVYPFNRLLQQRAMHLERIAQLNAQLDAYRFAQDDERAGDKSDPSPAALDLAGVQRMLLRYGLDVSSKTTSAVQPSRKMVLDGKYRRHFREVLLNTFFAGWSESVKGTAQFEADLDDHIEKRFTFFSDHVLPWVQSVAPNMGDMVALEVGSGTGSSTLAFAPHVREVICFEIDPASVQAAAQRAAYFGLNNIEQRQELFGPQSQFVTSGRRADLVVFCAVLEHMTYQELTQALRTAWDVLSPGGLLLVADTPNRLSSFDEHTSLLPFFTALPMEVMQSYAAHSPRSGFAEAIAVAPDNERELLLTRWGRGVSYHDFELVLGRDIHQHVVLDGYESAICDYAPLRIDDGLLRAVFDIHRVEAHRAFTRANLNFVLRKPI